MSSGMRRRTKTTVSATAASKKFGKYKKEDQKRAGKADVRDEAVERLMDAFRQFMHGKAIIEGLLEGLAYSSKDVEKFSLSLIEFQEDRNFSSKAGHFLSSLINNGADSDYVIHTGHMEAKIDLIGMENTKNITVHGDVGDEVGIHMKRGSILVEGNAGENAGLEMEGGSIVVMGDALKNIGIGMKGGHITIKGNTLGPIGNVERGTIIVHGDAIDLSIHIEEGEIHIEGDLRLAQGNPDISRIVSRKGKIYHKDELIAEDMASGLAFIDMYSGMENEESAFQYGFLPDDEEE